MRTLLQHSALLLTLCTLPVFAQTSDAPPAAAQTEGHGHHRMDPAKETRHLTKELGLSTEQAAQVEPILADRQNKVETLRGDTTLDQAGRRDRMHAIQADTEQRLNGILTDAQKQQFASLRAAHRHGRKGQDNGQPGGTQAPPVQ